MTGAPDDPAPDLRHQFPDIPGTGPVLAPSSPEELAGILRTASHRGTGVAVWGGGTHQGIGHPAAGDVVVTTRRLDRVVDWQPEDLTVTVQAGVTVADLEAMLAERDQTAVLPETPGAATVGGVIAAGVSGWRRLGYGPTRSRVLQVELATGDGRVVVAGGRVVKNATGYDLPRLVTGSLGSLGVIVSVCLKLWPVASHGGTVAVPDADVARRRVYRPLAVAETEHGAAVYLAGTSGAVTGPAADLGSEVRPGLHWPEPLPAVWRLSLRVPPSAMVDAVVRVRRHPGVTGFRAAHGIGEIEIGVDDLDPGPAYELRSWAERIGGSLVVVGRPHPGPGPIDPWGTPPPGVEIQRRIKTAFDPARVVNAGRLPGGI